MKALCITHVAFEGPARILDWALERGNGLDVVRADLPGASLSLDGYDNLVVMGGPMSANDGHAWLSTELRLIESALKRELRVLGVCLGAQLLAKVLGARVYPARYKEIGWWPIHLTPSAVDRELAMPHQFVPFHWHGETFDVPVGAERLAGSAAVENQAFLFEKRALGLQFHIEASGDSVGAIVREGADDITTGPWVQSGPAMLAECGTRCAALQSNCYSLLDSFLGATAVAG